MNVYENQILHSSILSFDPVIRKRELNPAGMPYVIFPGNVGSETDLRTAVEVLTEKDI